MKDDFTSLLSFTIILKALDGFFLFDSLPPVVELPLLPLDLSTKKFITLLNLTGFVVCLDKVFLNELILLLLLLLLLSFFSFLLSSIILTSLLLLSSFRQCSFLFLLGDTGFSITSILILVFLIMGLFPFLLFDSLSLIILLISLSILWSCFLIGELYIFSSNLPTTS